MHGTVRLIRTWSTLRSQGRFANSCRLWHVCGGKLIFPIFHLHPTTADSGPGMVHMPTPHPLFGGKSPFAIGNRLSSCLYSWVHLRMRVGGSVMHNVTPPMPPSWLWVWDDVMRRTLRGSILLVHLGNMYLHTWYVSPPLLGAGQVYPVNSRRQCLPVWLRMSLHTLMDNTGN